MTSLTSFAPQRIHMSIPTATELRPPAPVSRWEQLTLLVIILIGGGMRLAYPDRMMVEHFDEGVYASNFWFADQPGGVYPMQHLYAPPLLPTLIEWIFVFIGPSNAGAMWPSQIAGIVTIYLLWKLGRTWFGPVAGLSAATLCALSDIQVVFSRAALTDALLGMWWLLSLLILNKACNSGRSIHSVVAGIVVGLAWYTKYNGWMPLTITLGAILSRGLFCRGIWPLTRQALVAWGLAALVAFAVWSPWLWALQPQGGYSSVMANHRQYIVGLAGWTGSFGRQAAQLYAVATIWSATALAITYGAILVVALRLQRRDESGSDLNPGINDGHPSKKSLSSCIWTAAAVWVFLPGIPILAQLLLSLQGISGWWLWSRHEIGQRQSIQRGNLGYWILLVWFLGLLIITPLYQPYLRLTLPWVLSTFVGAGLSFQLAWVTMSCQSNAYRTYHSLRRFALITVACYMVCVGIVVPSWYRQSQIKKTYPVQSLPFVNQGTFKSSTERVAETVRINSFRRDDRSKTASVVYVYGEPGAVFQLRLLRLPDVYPIAGLSFVRKHYSGPEARVWLVVTRRAKNDRQFLDEFLANQNCLLEAKGWPWDYSPLVAMDQPNCDPLELGVDPDEIGELTLFEVVGPNFVPRETQ